jgi:hypothetical protein
MQSQIKIWREIKMNAKALKKLMIFSVMFLLMSGIITTLSSMPAKAQTTYTNMQEGGSVPGPLASGVTADLELDTRAFLSFTPNPIGLNQDLLVNVWMNPPIHVSRYFKDYQIIFTKPDGKTDVITVDSYRADTTAWFQYKVDQVGTWQIQFKFPGGYFPAGNYTIHAGAVLSMQADSVVSFTNSVYYKPSSTPVQNLTVQEDMVSSWPASPLPTDYWTRPISPENREWWVIAGSYPSTGYVGGGATWDQLYPDTNTHWSDRYHFTPWVQAPNSAHIVWGRQEALDGLTGGPAGTSSQLTNPGTPSVIYDGRCYQTATVPINGVPTSCAECYDLRTGEQYYAIPTSQGGVTPTIVAYTSTFATLAGKPAVPGATAGAGIAAELLTISGENLMKIDPLTGEVDTNVSISPLTSRSCTYYMNQYVLGIQDLGRELPADQRYRLINWTTAGTNDDFNDRIISNTSYARSRLPSIIDYSVGIGADVSSIAPDPSVYATQMLITAYSLTTGEELWNKTVDEAPFVSSAMVADHGKLAVATEMGRFLAFDLATGAQVWTSEQMSYPWDAAGFGAYTIQSAYGLIFREAYSGVYAFNWTNGKIVWKYKASATPFETPYIDENGSPVYSFSWNGGGNPGIEIADGKIYVYTCEHTPSLPITRGWSLHCINVTTGAGVWNITGYMSAGAVADGYLTTSNNYDGYMYVFGKGQSATTVTAPDTAVTLGNSIMIKGSVTDQSPAQPGTPCVSDASMSVWMEYLHMQEPMPANVTGVPVTLAVIDANNNYRTIGTVMSDASGTFSYMWQPDIPGKYTVIVTFAGSESYGSSSAETSFGVVEAPTATSAPTPTPMSTAETYFLPMSIGIIVAIAVVGAILALLLLRKRP